MASASSFSQARALSRHSAVIRLAADDKSALAALEQQGIAASEAWDTAVTDFLDPALVDRLESALDGRSDIGFVKIGGYGAASRARFVFTNPELIDSLDVSALDAEHAVMVRVDAAFDKAGNKLGSGGKLLPNLLAGIGVDFEQLGDVLFDEDTAAAYIVCADASTRKNIERLLPKSIGRATVEVTEPGYEPEGSLVEMAVGRLDKRDYK